MIRTVLYALLGIFLVTVVRMFINVIGKAISEQAFGGSDSSESPHTEQASTSSTGGELKKCVVCGAYSPVASAPRVKVSDAFICSDKCVALYKG